MTQSQSSFFRFFLFLFGAGIVLLTFFLATNGKELTQIDTFMWVSIGVMYLVLFLPFFFSSISIGKFSVKIPGLVFIWTGILCYIIASIVVIVLLAVKQFLSLNAAIVIQAVLVFFFAIDIFFAYFISTHVNNVAAGEAGKQQFITEIKSKAGVFSLSLNQLPAEYEAPQKMLRQTLEEIKYIYPVDNGAGSNLEMAIIAKLNTLSEICAGISTGAHSTTLAAEAVNLQMLVKQRKQLRN